MKSSDLASNTTKTYHREIKKTTFEINRDAIIQPCLANQKPCNIINSDENN